MPCPEDGTRGPMPACACRAVPQPSGTGSAGLAEPSSGPVAALAGSARAGCGAPHRGGRPAPGLGRGTLLCVPGTGGGGPVAGGLWLR